MSGLDLRPQASSFQDSSSSFTRMLHGTVDRPTRIAPYSFSENLDYALSSWFVDLLVRFCKKITRDSEGLAQTCRLGLRKGERRITLDTELQHGTPQPCLNAKRRGVSADCITTV